MKEHKIVRHGVIRHRVNSLCGLIPETGMTQDAVSTRSLNLPLFPFEIRGVLYASSAGARRLSSYQRYCIQKDTLKVRQFATLWQPKTGAYNYVVCQK